MALPIPMKRDPNEPRPSIHQQISEVERELAMRRNVYPKLVTAGKMKRNEADLCLARMEAVLVTLVYMRDNREAIVAAVQASARTA